MAVISPVHGGLDALVNCIVPALDAVELAPKIAVADVDVTTLYRIADGTLSPITGPMTKDQYDMVLAEKAIESNGKKYAWAIPIMLPVTADEAKTAVAGTKCALVDSAGKTFGTIDVSSAFEWDKKAFLKAVYLTDREDHPGAKLWIGDERSVLVGGSISLLEFDDPRPFKDRIFSPTTMRALLAEKGYEQSVAFQTRNPLHRAHEYALVYGAETILRETGKKTGVFLNPLVGQLKGDDVPAATRMDTYVKLIDDKVLGDGDKDAELWKAKGQDLNEQAHLAGLDMRMYYGGPSEAVMHAIYRQNLGLSHFIIGRKHADAPYDDGSNIWGDFDAQTIFENLGGEINIKTVNVGFAAYFEEIGRVGLVEANKEKTKISISGTKMRALLNEGKMPDSKVMRPTTAEILMAYYKTKNAA